MKNFWTILASLFALIVGAVATYLLLGYFKEKPGGVYVDTNPESNIYVNGNLVGKSPYHGSFPPGEIDLKLLPNSQNENLLAFATKITLTSGIETVVRREFGENEDSSSGDIMTFDKTGSADASLIVISTPNYAQVSIDGIPKGFAPYNNSSISPVGHQITISSPGFTDRVVTVKTISGFRLTLFAKLAKNQVKNPVAAPVPTPKTYIEILKTPTGFLRMRTKPGAAGEEIAELKVGSKYLYLDTDTTSGWYEIQYQDLAPGLPNGITGWVSNEYSKKIEAI
jgi:uncharacterized protein YgiM (DUF1202 family)